MHFINADSMLCYEHNCNAGSEDVRFDNGHQQIGMLTPTQASEIMIDPRRNPHSL